MTLIIIVAIVVFIFLFVVLGGVVFLFLHKGQVLSHATGQKFIQKIKDTRSLDSAHAILNSHKFFVAAISELFPDPSLTAAEKISKVANRFPNKAKIWHFHKLRNRVAHDVEIKVSKVEAENARNNFIRALGAIMEK